MKYLSPVLLALICSSCATVVRGTNDTAKFVSTPDGASVTAESVDVEKLGPLTCETPCELELKRKKTWRVDFFLDGYKPASGFLTPEISAGGVAAGAGNALIGGLIGVGIDAGTGANLDLKPNPMVAELQPVDSSLPSIIVGAKTTTEEEEQGKAIEEEVTEGDVIESDELENVEADAEIDADVDVDADVDADVDIDIEEPSESIADEPAAISDLSTDKVVSEGSEEAVKASTVNLEADNAAIDETHTVDTAAPAITRQYKPGERAPNDEEAADLNQQQLQNIQSTIDESDNF